MSTKTIIALVGDAVPVIAEKSMSQVHRDWKGAMKAGNLMEVTDSQNGLAFMVNPYSVVGLLDHDEVEALKAEHEG